MNNLYSDEQKVKTAQRLKNLREERGISHATLANSLEAQCGLTISRDSLMKYEKDDKLHSSFGATKGMAAETLYCLAKFYEVSIDYLLGNSNIKSPDTKMQAACKYTGLSEEAISKLKTHTDDQPPFLDILNALCEVGFINNVVYAFGNYIERVHSRVDMVYLADKNYPMDIPTREHIWNLKNIIDEYIDDIKNTFDSRFPIPISEKNSDMEKSESPSIKAAKELLSEENTVSTNTTEELK